MKSRRGIFGLDAVGLIGFIIIIVITMSVVAQAFTTQLQGAYVDLVSHMPTFGNATSTIGNTTSSVTHTINHSLKFMTNLDLFNLMRNVAISGLSLVIMFAGFSLMFENIKLMSPGTAYQIVSKGIFIVLFLFIFPTLWDAWAGAIEYGSQWLLDPANSGKSESVQIVFNYVTGDQAFFGPNIQTPGVLGLNPDGSVKSPLQILIQILDDPSVVTTYISNQLQAVLLSVIGGVITLIITILTFMFATIRQVLTAVLIIALPLILVINLVPFFQPITRKLIDALIGLSIVPIFSSLVLTAGAVYLNTLPTGELQGWFASISVLVLSAFMPIMLVPMIGSLFQSVTGLVSSGVMAGAMLTGNAALGGARGLSSALGSAGAIADASGAKIAPFDIAKTAMAGMGTGLLSGTIKGLSSAGGEAMGQFGLGKQSRQMIQNGGATVGDSILNKTGQVGQAAVIGSMSEVTGANARAMLLDSAALGSPSDPQARADALASFNKNYAPMMKMSPVDITDKLGFGSAIADKTKFGTDIKNTLGDISKNDDLKAGLAHNTWLYGGLNPTGLKSFVDSKGGTQNVMAQVDGNQRVIENKLGQSLTGSIHTPNVRNIPDATMKQSLSSEDLANIGTRMNLHILGAQTSNIQPDLISKQFADEVHLEVSNNQPGTATSSLVDMYLKNTIGNDRYISNPIHQELTSQMSNMIKSQGPDATAKMITQLRKEGDFNKKLDIKPEELYRQLGSNYISVTDALKKSGIESGGFDFHKILKYTGV